MTTLIVLGNINQYTFANSIVAANSKSLESLGEGLTRVFVIHSVKSQRALHDHLEWHAHLKENNIDPNILVESADDLREGSQQVDTLDKDVFYFGLDGDNTGTILEGLFLSSNNESGLRTLSKSIVKAIEKIEKIIRKQMAKGEVIFAAGDDILFKGVFDEELLGLLQRKYQDTTSGLTCSIGYGRSLQEVYLALKLAKSKPGKNCIMGINLP